METISGTLAHEPEPQTGEPCDTHDPYNKYIYTEFAGYDGERRLKSILRKILPMALYRTWEILAERQAPGNDCFLSIASISETAERVERTIRLNIHEMESRKLLVLRAEQKLFRQEDGTQRLKLVVVKDFTGLYALAHEYHRWSSVGCPVPPEREFAEFIRSNEALMRKLIRFNNYRRIIENKVPGPKPAERKEHRWYTAYDPAADTQDMGTPGGTAAPQQGAIHAEDATQQSTSTDRNLYLQKDLQKDLKKVSEERINTNNQNEQLNKDSFDSENPLKCRGFDYTKPHKQPDSEQERRESTPSYTTKTNPTNPSPDVSETSRAEQPARHEQANQDERARAFVQQAMAAYEATRGKIGGHGLHNAPKVKPNGLVSAFVREVSLLFCDENIKGSLTRALRAVEHTHLSQKDILACLVKAYLVTQQTKKVREQYRRPDGDIKMPLFVTMFARFTTDCAAGKFGYTNEHLVRDIAEDDRLVLFVVEHQLEELLLEGTVATDVKQEDEPVPSAAALSPENNSEPSTLTSDEVQAEAEQLEQQTEETQQYGITVADPVAGWATWENADHWAQLLREHYLYGVNDYAYDVLPAYYDGKPTNRWLFVFYAHRDPQHCWAVYGNKGDVDFHLESDETVWMAHDGVVGNEEAN